MTLTHQAAVAEAERKARRQNAVETVAQLDALSRQRALTTDETKRLSRAIYQTRSQGERQRYYWTGEMDRELLAMIRRKAAFKVIAATLGVTLKAAQMRASRLRRSEVADDC